MYHQANIIQSRKMSRHQHWFYVTFPLVACSTDLMKKVCYCRWSFETELYRINICGWNKKKKSFGVEHKPTI